MSSTYSPDLRIELIGTGDQAGVWGNTTNTNLSTVLESSIAGYTSVSIIASSQALTANYGAADQARFASIALTTTTGANFAVYAPPSPKQYVIYNASSYTATIYNSTVLGNTTAAGTGVAIPAGKVMTIWSDGTNFVQQNTHLLSPSFTTPTLGTPASGTLTNCSGLPLSTGVSGLGTGVATALAVNTGTDGAFIVRGAGLGTPSSGTLTNATGLPIASGVSGLGTGIATFLVTPSSANLASAVTDETGSGALVFADSPTLVTPALGTPSALVGTNITGTAASLTAGAVTNGVYTTNFTGSNQSIAASGYQKLPGGLIFQWGVADFTTSYSSKTVTFPIAFPSACVAVNINGSNSTYTDYGTNYVNAYSTTSFTAQSLGTATLWSAIGY